MPIKGPIARLEALDLLVSSVVDYAIVLLDAEGNITSWNAGAQLIKGYTADEIVGKNFACFYCLDDIDSGKPSQALKAADEEGRYEDFGWRVKKDGTPFFANVVITSFKDENGELLGFGKVTKDITAQFKADELLKERSQLLELTHDTIIVRDLNGTIKYWNKGAVEMYGFSADEAIGRKSHELLRTVFQSPRVEIEQQTIEHGRWDGELQHQSKDGRTIYVLSRWVRKDSPSGAIEFLELNNDITELKLAELAAAKMNHELELRVLERTSELLVSEADLRQKVLELERSNEDLQQFAYICSHDLQEPLRVISNYTQLLSKRYKDKLDDKGQQFIDFAVDASKRMQDLINALLVYSRVQTQARPMQSVDCTKILEETVHNLKLLIAESGATIECSEPLPVVTGDRTQLIQLFQNLISNAIKFKSKEPPRIVISTKRENGFWRFDFSDNGIGFDMRFADRIFVIFQRLHNREDYPGSGIGLAVCKKIVYRHRGDMSADSVVGKGSTFHFTLPSAQEVQQNSL
ncbi:MAG TPA: PAS domain S-box protein [Oculatellaceae cyanobacterium]